MRCSFSVRKWCACLAPCTVMCVCRSNMSEGGKTNMSEEAYSEHQAITHTTAICPQEEPQALGAEHLATRWCAVGHLVSCREQPSAPDQAVHAGALERKQPIVGSPLISSSCPTEAVTEPAWHGRERRCRLPGGANTKHGALRNIDDTKNSRGTEGGLAKDANRRSGNC